MDKCSLSSPRQWLIKRCQYANFGSLTFQVRGGEPDISRPHRLTRTVKLTEGDNGPRSEMASTDFELRREHIALLAQLECLPDGTCVRVKVAHGLPGNSIDIEESAPTA